MSIPCPSPCPAHHLAEELASCWDISEVGCIQLCAKVYVLYLVNKKVDHVLASGWQPNLAAEVLEAPAVFNGIIAELVAKGVKLVHDHILWDAELLLDGGGEVVPASPVLQVVSDEPFSDFIATGVDDQVNLLNSPSLDVRNEAAA
jgi:hypothetical protein